MAPGKIVLLSSLMLQGTRMFPFGNTVLNARCLLLTIPFPKNGGLIPLGPLARKKPWPFFVFVCSHLAAPCPADDNPGTVRKSLRGARIAEIGVLLLSGCPLTPLAEFFCYPP